MARARIARSASPLRSTAKITIREHPGISHCLLTFRLGTLADSRDTTYTIRVGSIQTALSKKRLYGNRSYGPVPVWSDYLVLTTMPKSCGFLYSWASEPATFFRDAATVVSGDRMDAIVPVPAKARVVLGSKAMLVSRSQSPNRTTASSAEADGTGRRTQRPRASWRIRRQPR